MKNKFSEAGSLESRQILRCVGIDPYSARENLVWAPNWSHTIAYAEKVLGRLKKVKGNKAKIIEELKAIALNFIQNTGGFQASKGNNTVDGEIDD